ncbi:DUF6932 family protein [Runella zeae]|uniref:DUF6932 family protein n=1 Tax=Runella zeae TaxID=94255 RepID=UPI0023543D45|nr:hypothetical protein [Runella zeae]
MIFDQYGYLTPYDVIPTDFETFEQVFVKGFSEMSKRQQWFDNYLAYMNSLKQVIGTGFVQWVDGSFVSQKFNPNDIDFLTFIDFERYQRHEKEIEAFRLRRYSRKLGTDGCFVKVYPPDHSLYGIYQIEYKRWLFDFTTEYVTKRSKGTIQLNF